MSNLKQLVNSKPLNASYTKAELIALEHEWRIKLKKSGFNDIEMWDNKPLKKQKRIKFIKGHIRLEWTKRKRTKEDFIRKAEQCGEYFRVIGLWANHCPTILPKYREILQDYSISGNLSLSIAKYNPNIKLKSICEYLSYNSKKILDFSTKLLDEEDIEDLIEVCEVRAA